MFDRGVTPCEVRERGATLTSTCHRHLHFALHLHSAGFRAPAASSQPHLHLAAGWSHLVPLSWERREQRRRRLATTWPGISSIRNVTYLQSQSSQSHPAGGSLGCWCQWRWNNPHAGRHGSWFRGRGDDGAQVSGNLNEWGMGPVLATALL